MLLKRTLGLVRRGRDDVPISEGSVVPSTSPRSGSACMHPYIPIGDAVGSSFFEYVPSITNRAASEVGLNESMEVTPIPRSSSSPSILHNPLQPAWKTELQRKQLATSASSRFPMSSLPGFHRWKHCLKLLRNQKW